MQIKELLSKYYDGSASEQEVKELMKLIVLDDSYEDFTVIMKEKWENRETINDQFTEFSGQKMLDRIIPFSQQKVHAPHRVHFLKTAWLRWAAAIIILFGIGTYLFVITSQPDKEVVIDQSSPKSTDILPGYNRAVLTLSDGQRVILDSATSETITDQTLFIHNNNGQLIYKHNNLAAINTMTTPNGGQYQLTLADGTNVWLNAASSITYPTAFTGKNREVNITGEVYFEIKANKAKPFIVRTTSDQIMVLGTSFNVNAYADEMGVRTSLAEGAVKIGDTNIKPGEAYQRGKITKTNIKQDIAWKNGYFDFENMNWENALRQLARWYNIDIEVKGSLPKSKLKGKLGRDLTLSQILSTLEEIGINTQLKGNILVVLP